MRQRIAANDDAPSIGGLIYALNQKPSTKPFTYTGIASAIWTVIGLVFFWLQLAPEITKGITASEILARPTTFLAVAAVLVPIAIIWFLALLVVRAEELRLRSSTMTEVAVRLAEPDRMAEQQIASLGQAVRRQVSFMNDAVSRALGRAGELEALVHNEVAALERSYEENERKIRSLIQELSGERHALVDTGDRVSETLKSLGTEVPAIIDRLSNQQLKLAHIIKGAGENLSSLETAIDGSAGRLEGALGTRTQQLHTVLEDYTRTLTDTLGNRTEHMQGMLEQYTTALGSALGDRTGQMEVLLESYTAALATALSARAESLETVFEEYSRALDSTMTNRAQALDLQLVERTRALDSAFEDRLRLFDETIQRSAQVIDTTVGERANAITAALESHAQSFSTTVGRQSAELDESLMRGISAVRRSSENITRQSLKAIESLAGQSDMLKNVSENLLNQIGMVTSRFEAQGSTIMRAANALESANYKIDQTLQMRHQDLSQTLDRLSGKANEFGKVLEDYSTSIEGTMSEAELRARAVADELRSGTEARKRLAIEDLNRMKAEADAESERALDDLRRRFSNVSGEVTRQLGSLTSRFDETSSEVRQHAARTAAEIGAEQARLKQQIETLPTMTRESSDAMRRALQDQLRALEQLSTLTQRSAQARDVTAPIPGGAASSASPAYEPRPIDGSGRPPLSSLSQTLANELASRARTTVTPQPGQAVPQQAALPPPAPGAQGGRPQAGRPGEARQGDGRQGGDGWSLGDLLARASHDEEHGGAQVGQPSPTLAAPAVAPAHPLQPQHQPPAASGPYALNVDVMARAVDPATAAAVWSRIRAGSRGVMVRSIYSPEGRVVFDDVSRRYPHDLDLQQTVMRYLSEFERILRDADARDPTGRVAQGHLVSETGRVYLFLAHASGRLI